METEIKPEIQNENKAEEINSDKVLEFENLTQEQKEELKERINEYKGLIRVFIHSASILAMHKNELQEPLIRVLKSEKSPPLFFLEEGRFFKALERAIGAANEKGLLARPIYGIRTLKNLPYPIMKDKLPPPAEEINSKISEENLSYGTKSTGIFLFNLHELGVRKILIGGSELIIDESGNINKCVGNFIDELDKLKKMGEMYPDAPKIDYKVSEITEPKNRSDLKGIRDDLVENRKL